MKRIAHYCGHLPTVLVDIFPADMQLVPAEKCTMQELVKILKDLMKLKEMFQNLYVHLCNISKCLDLPIRAFNTA